MREPPSVHLISFAFSISFVNYLRAGVDVNVKNDDGRTPLMMACYPAEAETRYLNAKCDICELLIGKSQSDQQTGRAFLISILSCSRLCNCVFLCPGAGADVDATTNESKNTALHIASKYSLRDECEILLRAGADTTLRNREGMTAAELADDASVKALFLKQQQLQQQHKEQDCSSTSSYPPLPSNVNSNPPSPSRKGSHVCAGAGSDRPSAKRSSLNMISSSMKVTVQ